MLLQMGPQPTDWWVCALPWRPHWNRHIYVYEVLDFGQHCVWSLKNVDLISVTVDFGEQEVWKITCITFFTVLGGRALSLCHTASLLHSLGSVTVRVCVVLSDSA